MAQRKVQEIQEIQKVLNPIRAGNAVLIRTVTMYYTGRIVSIEPDVLVLTDAAWIADTGRFGEALKTGVFVDIEPYPDPVAVGRAGIIDVTTWAHALPRDPK